MGIEKHQPWGDAGALSAEGVVVRTNAELRRALTASRESGRSIEVGLLGGDLCRTVGGRGDESRFHREDAVRLPIDLGLAVLDGVEHVFAAHMVVRHRWLRGRVVAIMNAQWIGAWDVAPRSHPNDGLLDVFDGDLGLDDRLKARKRLLTGTHVPHPEIAEQRVPHVALELERPTPVWLDGERVAVARRVEASLVPDAYVCVV